MNVDEVISNIVRLRDEATDLNKKIDEIKQERAQYEAQLMSMMAEMGATQMGSKHGTAYMKMKQVPFISNWDEFAPFCAQNLQLLQKRISAPAVKEILDTGEEIPGLSFVEEFTISVTRK
jgi:cell division septum initiation protein DivIVA